MIAWPFEWELQSTTSSNSTVKQVTLFLSLHLSLQSNSFCFGRKRNLNLNLRRFNNVQACCKISTYYPNLTFIFLAVVEGFCFIKQIWSQKIAVPQRGLRQNEKRVWEEWIIQMFGRIILFCFLYMQVCNYFFFGNPEVSIILGRLIGFKFSRGSNCVGWEKFATFGAWRFTSQRRNMVITRLRA